MLPKVREQELELELRTVSGMLGSRLHLTFLALSYLHGSPCGTIFLLLVVLGEVQASTHWPRPSPMPMSEAI